MNLDALIPKEVLQLKEKNEKYAKIISQSIHISKEEREKKKKELKIAPTPFDIIYTEGSLKLYHFRGNAKNAYKTPLLIIPSLILRYYIMDLIKGHSLIEHLVNMGNEVYLIDWGIPGDEHGELTFDDYIDTFIRRSVRKVSRLHGKQPINILGQCLGGTMAAIYTALYPEHINKLLLLTAPIDFKDAGLLALWTKKSIFNVDKVVKAFGPVIPADFLHSCFQFLDIKATVERYKKLYNNVLDENFLYLYNSLDHWLNDKIPFPGKVFHKFIKGLYQENSLIKDEFMINERPVKLDNINCPTLTIASQFDHVFPESAVRALENKAGKNVIYHTIGAGHVTLITLFPQREETYKITSDFLNT